MVDGSLRFSLPNGLTCSIAAVCAVALASAALALGPQREQNAETIEFSARVTDFQYENPIDQVRIDLVRLPDEIVDSRFSDSKGEATFTGVHPGAYALRTVKDGYNAVEVQVTFRRDQRIGQIELRLPRTAPAGPLTPGAELVSARMLSIPQVARKEFEFLNQKKDPKGSLEHFQKAIAAYPEYYEAYFLAGMADLQLKQPDDARAALAQAVKLNSRFIQPYYPLATLLMGQKHYGEAESLLAQAQELDPNGWLWPFELARSKAYQKQWDQALAYGETALKIASAPPKVHLLMADLYENTGSPAKAIPELEQFEKLDPNSPYIPRVREVLAQLRGKGGTQ
jgi:tetratricopeptide (TPR) repeat protein